MNVIPLPTDPAQIPGGLQEHKIRQLADGTQIEFEFAPAGYLTKKGEIRRQDWRAYHVTVPGEKRSRVPSVSTLLDAITPKPGLKHWGEQQGIEGCFEAVRLGELDPTIHTAEDAVYRVRALKLGLDGAMRRAQSRGLDAHEVVEVYMVTGQLPPRDSYPPEVHGYYQGIAAWILDKQPRPLEVEQLVASPEDGYAGRSDLVALVDGKRVRYDAKTQERGQVYDAAHIQVGLYERAAVSIGDEPSDECRVVVFSADGRYRDMPGLASTEVIDAALAYYRAVKPVTSGCESANRQARKEAA